MGSVIISGGRPVRARSSTTAALQEAMSDVARQLEDLTYTNLSADETQVTGDERRRDMLRARRLRRKNPLAKQGGQLLQHYVLGQGVSVKANNKAKVARIIDEFWDNPVNQQVLTSHEAMAEFIDGVWTDGERFLVYLDDEEDGTVELSTILPEYVDEVIPDPSNRAIPAWYKVQKRKRSYDWAQGRSEVMTQGEFEYYRDWAYTGEFAPPASLQAKGLVRHVFINRRGFRGESDLGAALDWVNAHRQFMENRSTLNAAAATVAWVKKRKGPAADIAHQLEALRSSVVNGSGRAESNPPPAPGSTLIENEASETKWMETNTGGASADYDERKLRMMAGAGMGGIPNHYFGDEAAANLATATAMELPLLKQYEDWQTRMGSLLMSMLTHVLEVAHEAGRIGPRDDAQRYAARPTTTHPITARVEQGPSRPDPFAITEAAADEGTTKNPTLSAGLQLTMAPREEPLTITQLEQDDTGAVDWTIDVDWSPIIQKDIGTYVTAMVALYGILPAQNIESQKLVVELVLVALGQGQDLEGVMERLFPPDMVPVEQMQKLAGLANTLNPPPPPPPFQPKQLGAGASMKEAGSQAVATLAEYRIRRLSEAAAAAGVSTDAADLPAVAAGS